jgi:uncharacterized protein (TIGR03435 family)
MAVLLLTGMLAAQTERPTFEVASIKPDPDCASRGAAAVGLTPGRVSLPCVPLRALIGMAYGNVFAGGKINARQPQVLGGPGWLDSERYALSAKAEGKATTAEMMGPMLQTLLEERFHVQIHKESRETPVYALTVAKNGPKLTPAAEGSCTPFDVNHIDESMLRKPNVRYCGMGSMRGNSTSTTAEWPGVTMEEFASRMLGNFAGRPVVDKTGLTGRYDIKLEFTPERMAGPVRLNGVDQPPLPEADSGGLSIFSALQEQLGLKLVAEKGTTEVILVDRAEKPAAN